MATATATVTAILHAALLLLARAGCALSDPQLPQPDTAAVPEALMLDSGEPPPPPPAALTVYSNYEHAHYQMHDVVFYDLAQDHNLRHDALPGDPDWLDPDLLKAWAIQESGAVSSSSWRTWETGDIMQVNNPGDWSEDKRVKMGLRRNQDLSPGMSIMYAIRWAYHKGCVYRQGASVSSAGWRPFSRWSWSQGRLRRHRLQGYLRHFTTWRRALFNYNGNRTPWAEYNPDALIVERDGSLYETREHYVSTIFERYEGAHR